MKDFQHCHSCGQALRNAFIRNQCCNDHFRHQSNCSCHLKCCCNKNHSLQICDSHSCGQALRNAFIRNQCCNDHFRHQSNCSCHLKCCCNKNHSLQICDRFFEFRSSECCPRKEIRLLTPLKKRCNHGRCCCHSFHH